jgi:superfamily II DNA/RNA helicase
MKNTAKDKIQMDSKNNAQADSMTNILTGSIGALGIAPLLCARLLEKNIHKPTEIQRLGVPRLLEGEDLLFQAPTGTGKTFAYLLPLFQRLFINVDEVSDEVLSETSGANPGKVRLLIIAPTLELCSQIKGEADFLLGAWPAGKAPRAALIIGSADIKRQIETLKKENPAVVVGNPVRLLQLARMRSLRLDGVKALVLDEGDRLAANEMFEETEALLRFVPAEKRQIAACSATISAKSRKRLLSLFYPSGTNTAGVVNAAGVDTGATTGTNTAGANTAAFIKAEEKITGIEHWAFFAENRKKIASLRSFLAAAKPKKALVFTARGGDAGNILSQLQYHHFAAGGIWGDMDKRARKAAMDGFRQGNLSILVASDLACRGLDIAGISHVIALDVPDDPELYLHRSGRTGRTGKRGIMASIGNEEDLRNLQKIEKKLGITVYPKELYGGRILAPEAEELGMRNEK